MEKRSLLFTALLVGTTLAAIPASAQTKIGTNPATIDSSALLELSSTTKGFLPPRMTQAQFTAISNPAIGLMVYCLDCSVPGLQLFNGSVWTLLNGAATFTASSLSSSGPLAGTYQQGLPTTASNTKQVSIGIAVGGAYTITTDTVNGVSFRASGTTNTAGTNTVTLVASGTPVAAGTFTYTLSTPGQPSATFTVTYGAVATFGTPTTNLTSALNNGQSYNVTNVVSVPYTSGNGQAYGTTTLGPVNGLTLTRTAGTYSASSGTVSYNLSGTYTGTSGTMVTFTLPDGGSTVTLPKYVNVSTFAGSTQGTADGTGTAAQFAIPTGVALDGSGNLYVGDASNHRIRKITPAGVVSTLAGSTAGFADGTGTAAQFYLPYGVAVDTGGNVYVADRSNHRIRKVTPAGVVSTLAGSSQGFADGTGTAAQFNAPYGVAVDGSGNLYVGDVGNNRIRKITPAGVVSTFAGSGTRGSVDGTGAAAQFYSPSGLAVDGSSNVYVADVGNHRIRKITSAGVVSTLAGTTQGSADGAGTVAQFYFPYGVAVDGSGNVYVADQFNNRIRKITPAGVVSTLAGGTQGYADGAGTVAQFYQPGGIVVDGNGTLYVADGANNRIRKITP